jgi:polyphosphate kinase 2 (PPK2 family)
MFERTSHEMSRWDVIAAEQKRFGRIAVLETLNTRIEEGMRLHGMAVPELSDLDIIDD